MKNAPFLAIFVLVFVALNTAAIRKKDNPVVRTQTSPIDYNEKMEEVKDGEKGAALPTMDIYPKANFMTASPVKTDKQVEMEEPVQKNPEAEDFVIEDEVSTGEDEGDWWLDDDSASDSSTEETSEESSDFTDKQ